MPRTQTVAEQAIRLRLAAHKKSQAWLAEQVGESPFWIGRRMSGKVTFDLDDLDRISEAFDVDIDELLASADSLSKRVAA